MKRFASLFAAAGAVAALSAVVFVGGAGAASSLPTLTITETGTTGISLSSTNLAEGAISVTATHSGKGMGSFGLVRLNPNESPATAIQQGFGAVQGSHGDLNALTLTGNFLIASANAPGTIQVNLTPGDYIAVNTSGNQPAFTQFHVHPTGSPAALPAAAATETSIEFGFKGPSVLHKGTIVRAENAGYLVHMIDLIGAKNKSAAQKLVVALRKGEGRKKLRPFLNNQFVSLLNPASPGAEQQMVLNAKPGFYVEACFMNTQDGREHTEIGMERLVRVKK